MQAKLDVKYLASRYDRGEKRVKEIMQRSQRYIAVDSLQSGLPNLLQHLNAEGADTRVFLVLGLLKSYKSDFGCSLTYSLTVTVH